MGINLQELCELLNKEFLKNPDFWYVVTHLAIGVVVSISLSSLLRRRFKPLEGDRWKSLREFSMQISWPLAFILYVLWAFGTFANKDSRLWHLFLDLSTISFLWKVSVAIFDIWLKGTPYRWIFSRTLAVIKLTLVLFVLLKFLHYLNLSNVESKIAVISLKLVILGVITMTLMRKEKVISLFPDKIELPNYRKTMMILNKIYYPLLTISLVVFFVRILGYYASFQKIFFQLWVCVALYVIYSYIHYILLQWCEKNPEEYRKATYSLTIYIVFILFMVSLLKVIGIHDFLIAYSSRFVVFTIRDTGITLYQIVKSILLLVGIYRLGRFVREFINAKLSVLLRWPDTVRVPMSVFSMYFIVFLGIVVSLKIVGVDLTALSIFAGALGVGVGIGLQDISRSMISGITILLTKIVKIGDLVVVKEHTGRVERMDIRSITIRTLDNVELIVPSQQFLNSLVVNLTYSNPIVRLHIPFGVSYGSDPDKVKKVVLEAIGSYTFVEPTPPPEVLFLEFGDNALNFELVVWYNSRYREMKFIRSDINYIIHRALTENDLEIPFPQRDVHIKSGVPWGDIIEALKLLRDNKKGDDNIGTVDKRD